MLNVSVNANYLGALWCMEWVKPDEVSRSEPEKRWEDHAPPKIDGWCSSESNEYVDVEKSLPLRQHLDAHGP